MNNSVKIMVLTAVLGLGLASLGLAKGPTDKDNTEAEAREVNATP